MIKNVKLAEFLAYTSFKDDLIEYKCLCCNKIINKNFMKIYRNEFFHTYIFSNLNKNKFILLLQNGDWPYKYMDAWEKLNEASLPKKECFYSHLNMEDTTDADYTHAKRFCNKRFRRIS